jgi:hypothetical protein
MPFAENTLEAALPVASVVSVSVVVPFEEKVPLAPIVGAPNVTATPLIGLELLSSTVATNGAGKAVLISVLCGVPLVAVIDAIAPAEFVRLKVAGTGTPPTVAITVSEPGVPFAVNAEAVARPAALVVAVVVLLTVLANVPLAPVAGARNVTIAFPTGFWPLSTTLATRRVPKVVLIPELCGVPLTAVIAAGAPVVLLRLKLAPACAPDAEAVTVYAPAVPFAVKAAAVADPLASLVAVVVLVPVSANVPLAPVVGAVKVTATPLARDPLFVTVTTRGATKAPSIAWLCGVPLVTVIASTVEPTGGRRSPVVQFTSPIRQIVSRAVHQALCFIRFSIASKLDRSFPPLRQGITAVTPVITSYCPGGSTSLCSGGVTFTLERELRLVVPPISLCGVTRMRQSREDSRLSSAQK